MTTLAEIASEWPNEARRLAEVTGERRTRFEAWMAELEIEHQKVGRPYGARPIAEITGPVCWLSFFDDDFTPAEALEEDMSNAEWETAGDGD